MIVTTSPKFGPRTSSVLDPLFCQVFDSLCRAAAAKVQDFNSQGLADTLWAMAKTGRVRPEVFALLCWAAAAKVQDFNAQELANSQCALDLTNTLGPWPQ